MSQWIDTTLGEICSLGGGNIQTGPFGSQLHASDYVEIGIPSVMPQNIGDNTILETGIARITEADADRLSKYRLHTDDIVYSRRGDVERRSLIRAENDGWLCGTGCLKVCFGDAPVADPTFISHYLGTEETREWIVRHAVGATMLNLNTKILSAVPLTIPPLQEQHAIADVLGALDDKIAANTKLAATATSLVQSEFQRLMKLADQETTIGETLTLEYGKSLAATKRVPGTVDVFGSGGIVGKHDTALLPGPGVIVGRKGTAGAVHWSPEPYFPIDTTYYVVPRNADISQLFAYFLLRSARLDEMNSDSAVPGLNRNEAHAAKVKLPNSANLLSFTSSMNPVFQISTQCDKENNFLAATRDALLPQLMSGKLRVRDAESIVLAAV